MDDLNKLSANGGNDLYGAGAWSITGSDIATIALTGTNGTANITAGGVTKLATFASDLTTTAANFVTANAAAYLAVGITLTSSVANLIFTVVSGTVVVNASIANVTLTLSGTIVKSGFRLPHPVYSFNVVADVVVTSANYRTLNGVIAGLYKFFMGQTLPAGTLIVFEYPVTNIVIASGSLIMNHIK